MFVLDVLLYSASDQVISHHFNGTEVIQCRVPVTLLLIYCVLDLLSGCIIILLRSSTQTSRRSLLISDLSLITLNASAVCYKDMKLLINEVQKVV